MDLWEEKAGPRQQVDSSRGPTLIKLLRELDAFGPRGFGDVEQAFRDPSRKVEEDEVFDMSGTSPHRLCEQTEHAPHRFGIALEHVHEVRAAECERGRLGHRRHRRRSLRLVEEGQVPEHVAPALESDHDLAPRVVGHRDFHRSSDDEEHVSGFVVAMEDHLVAREVA